MDKLSIRPTTADRIFGWIYFPFQLIALPTILVQANDLLHLSFSVSTLNFIFFALNFIVISISFRRFLLKSVRFSLHAPKKTIIHALFGFLIYWGGNTIVSYIILFSGVDFFNVNDTTIDMMAQESYGLIMIGTVLLAPISEEVMFRGLIFGSLYNQNKHLAYAVSTLLFAFIHILGYIGSYEPVHLLLCLLQYIPAGLSLAWAYSRANSILAPIMMHIAINLIGMLAMR